VIGPIINATGILVGGIAGLVAKKPLPISFESWSKVTLGAFTVYYGLRLTILSLGGSIGHILKQLAIVILAMIIGKLLGRLFHLQKFSNRLGQMAKEQITAAGSGTAPMSAGFKTCTALFCAAPLGIVGAVVDGSSGYYYPLIVKGIIDGLATMGLFKIFGWGAAISALPVLAFFGTLSLLSSQLSFMRAGEFIWPINAVAGFLIFSVALVILQIKRLELADYLPSLVVAPLLAALWH
jgi:uncharacterized membrane protein YqgA involved in biofilm formation